MDKPRQPAAGNADAAVVKLTPPTPGDWFIDDNEDDYTIATTMGTIICRVLTADDYPCREEGIDDHINDEAASNARLIAAAPAMLAQLVRDRDNFRSLSQSDDDACAAAARRIDGVIAKATGAAS